MDVICRRALGVEHSTSRPNKRINCRPPVWSKRRKAPTKRAQRRRICCPLKRSPLLPTPSPPVRECSARPLCFLLSSVRTTAQQRYACGRRTRAARARADRPRGRGGEAEGGGRAALRWRAVAEGALGPLQQGPDKWRPPPR